MAARAGVEPTTLRLKAIDSTKAPPCSHNRGKNGGENPRGRPRTMLLHWTIKDDHIEQVEGVSRTTWRMASLEARNGKAENQRKKMRIM